MPENTLAAPNRRLITSLKDIDFVMISKLGQYSHHSFYHITSEDKVWHGTMKKSSMWDHPTLEEFIQHLQPIEDAKVWPEKPANITVAPALENVFIKRPGLEDLDDGETGFAFAKSELLHESSIMEIVTPHPNIIKYYGCRVFRGRITGIVLERLAQDLRDPPHIPDIPAFLAELQSAVDYIHSFGLSHNDIKPENIMIKDGKPILIDFGSCYPAGRLPKGSFSSGSPGWCDESIKGPAKEHDIFAMKRLREFLENDAKERAAKENGSKENVPSDNAVKEKGAQEDDTKDNGVQMNGAK